MTETKARALYASDPRLSALRREDLASFLVGLPTGVVLSATPACEALGLAADMPAPAQAAEIARSWTQTPSRAAGLVRLRLPRALASHVFRCIPIDLATGPAMLFADPAALAADDAARAVPDRAPAPLPIGASESPPVRFSFETDADDRLKYLSPQIANALGEGRGDWIGSSFPELEQAGLVLSGTAAAEALARGASFSGVHVTVPGATILELELGGVPLFDPARRRVATRGFGILRAWTSTWSPSPADAPTGRPGPRAPADDVSPNVVRLRGGALSPKESTAFREIARTLNAALGDGPEAPGALWSEALYRVMEGGLRTPAGDDDRASVSPQTGTLHDPRVLDRLPLALLLQQGDELVQANQTFFDWTQWADLAAFAAAGGLHFAPMGADRATTFVPTASGERLPVELHRMPADFLAADTRIMVLRRRDDDTPSLSPAQIESLRARARREGLDLVPWPVLLVKADCTIQFANRAAGERFALPPEDLAAQPLTLVVAPSARPDAIAWFDAAAAGDARRAAEREILLRARGGAEFPAMASLCPVADAGATLCLVLAPLPPAATASAEAHTPAPRAEARTATPTPRAEARAPALNPSAEGRAPAPAAAPRVEIAPATPPAPASPTPASLAPASLAPASLAPAPHAPAPPVPAPPPPAPLTPGTEMSRPAPAATPTSEPAPRAEMPPPVAPPAPGDRVAAAPQAVAAPAARTAGAPQAKQMEAAAATQAAVTPARPANLPSPAAAPPERDAAREIGLQPTEALRQAARRISETLGGSFATLAAYRPDETAAAPLPEPVRAAVAAVRATFDDLAALAAPVEVAPKAPCDVAAVVRDAMAHVSAGARRRRVALRADIEACAPVSLHVPRLARLVRLMLDEALSAAPAGTAVTVSLSTEEAGALALHVTDAGEPVDEVAVAAARQPLAASGAPDRFSKAGRPLRYARMAADAEALGAGFALQRGMTVGAGAILRLPR